MRALVEIDDSVLKEVINLTGAKSKKRAIIIAINDYLKMKKREALKKLIGNYDLGIDLKSLEKARSGN